MMFLNRRRHLCTVALDRNEVGKLLSGADKLLILPEAVYSGSGELARLVHPGINKLLAIRSLLSFLILVIFLEPLIEL